MSASVSNPAVTGTGLGRGLIERIAAAGIERAELGKESPNALIGGIRTPYRPKDLASILTIISPHNPKSYLALEVAAKGGIEFIGAITGGMYLQGIDLHNRSPIELRSYLRKLRFKFDVVTLDGRGLMLDAGMIWKYLEGGKEPQANEFAKGPPVNYGASKIKEGTIIVLNLIDPDTKALYHRLRSRYRLMFSSPFVGVVRV